MKSDSGRLNFSYVVCSVQDLTVKAQIISKEVKDAQTISVKKKKCNKGDSFGVFIYEKADWLTTSCSLPFWL